VENRSLSRSSSDIFFFLSGPRGKQVICHVRHRIFADDALYKWYINPRLLLEKGKISLHDTDPKQKKGKSLIILPAPKMRSNMDTKQVAQRSSLGALQRRNLVYIHAHNTS